MRTLSQSPRGTSVSSMMSAGDFAVAGTLHNQPDCVLHLLRVPKFTTPFQLSRPDADCFRKSRIEVQACVGRRRRSGWLRECPPACGLLWTSNIPFRVGDRAKGLSHKSSHFATLPTAPRSAGSVGGLRGDRTPTRLEGSGNWGAQRSGIKEEAKGRGTAAELSAPVV